MRPEERWSQAAPVACEEADSVSGRPTTDVDEEDGSPQICRVCGDKANGYHFNVLTCEGCKGFFRRAMKRNVRLRCPFRKGTCEITRKTRRQCQACRLRKCLESGMKKEMIMSDAAVEQRRALIKKKKKERLEAQPPGVQGLTPEQRMLIAELMDAQTKTFDTTFSHFKDFRLPKVFNSECETPELLQSPLGEPSLNWSEFRKELCPMKISLQLRGEDGSVWNYNPPAYRDGKEIIPMLPHLADMSTYMFKGVINFAKVISYFRDLPIEDQISLLKGATFEMCVLRFNTLFNTETGTWECGRLVYCFEDPEGGFQKLLVDPAIKFHYMLKKLQLHKEEYVLMQAISLFSPDRPGVVERRAVDQLQERFALTLKAYIECSRPQPAHRFLFMKIMAVLTELRSLNAQHTQQLLRIQDTNHFFTTPLIQELISNTDD
ncbi:PREDICTED: nuclear receptor subfamily 1 group I member 2 [Dipodomys ordii]|uniref:Nuclear receptor subfamily 1 group I member 2 n=1 Tax=Dipodomys ordii TaxID=10020 RepID=A0A1S3FEC4_DIPOR|nr:PREDICTED: nuclear receptor subfamily 1 group I member 2 [Dipodomys ordii]XP_012874831.1 PREDICTED: nuclear receptor subfamily 1 group I member 2 [Dipodomys ordii]